jgi:hypothetical protein
MTDQVRRGTVISFDPTLWQAAILLDGADVEATLPVGQWVSADTMAVDSPVAVLVFGETDTNDGVVLGPYGALGSAGIPTFAGLNIKSTTFPGMTFTADGQPAGMDFISYNGGGTYQALRAKGARGSLAAPTASLNGDGLFIIQATGYEAVTPAFGTLAAVLKYMTSQAWTNVNQGTAWLLYTTPNGATVPILAVTIDNAQGMTIAGGLNVAATGAAVGEVVAGAGFHAGGQTGAQLNMQKITSLANLGNVTLLAGALFNGLVVVSDSRACLALFNLRAGAHLTEELMDSTNQYSITSGTAFTNIYWNGTAYELENRTGLTLSYYLSFLGN